MVLPGETFTVKTGIELKDDNGTDYPQIASAKINSDSWTLIEGTYTVDYYGNIGTLNLNIETADDGIGKSFYVDDVFVAEKSVKVPTIAEATPAPTYNSYSGIWHTLRLGCQCQRQYGKDRGQA